MERYPSISEHGLIGDLQTAALVCTDGTIDFFCCPRFDSPSVFASLLDAEKGGYFRVRPAADNYVTKQLYFPNTAMLITRFMTPDGVGEVLDFMPVVEGAPTDRHRLVRVSCGSPAGLCSSWSKVQPRCRLWPGGPPHCRDPLTRGRSLPQCGRDRADSSLGGRPVSTRPCTAGALRRRTARHLHHA